MGGIEKIRDLALRQIPSSSGTLVWKTESRLVVLVGGDQLRERITKLLVFANPPTPDFDMVSNSVFSILPHLETCLRPFRGVCRWGATWEVDNNGQPLLMFRVKRSVRGMTLRAPLRTGPSSLRMPFLTPSQTCSRPIRRLAAQKVGPRQSESGFTAFPVNERCGACRRPTCRRQAP